jgi:hypothetical protein
VAPTSARRDQSDKGHDAFRWKSRSCLRPSAASSMRRPRSGA